MIDLLKKIQLLFQGTTERVKISKNIGWLFIEKAVQFTLGFFVSVIVARYLGTSEFGILSYALAVVGIVGALVGFGLGSILIRELIKQPENKGVLLGTVFWASFASGILAQLLSILIILLLRPDDSLTIAIVSILSIAYILRSFSTIAYYFESQVQAKLIVPVTLTALTLSSCLKLYFVYQKWSLKAFAWGLTFESIFMALGLLWIYQKYVGDLQKWTFDVKVAKVLLKDSLPLMFSSIMIIVYMKIDQIMIREMISESEVGLYATAVRLTEIWYFIPIIITQSFFPKMVQSIEENPSLFYLQLQRLYNLVVLIAYGIAIPVSIFATSIVTFIYGEAFAPAGFMLSLLIWTGLPVALGTVRGTFILTMNWTRIYLLITIFSTLLNIMLNWYLIPIYGGLGAVIATLVSYSFAAIFSCFIYQPLWRNGVMMIKSLLYPNIFNT